MSDSPETIVVEPRPELQCRYRGKKCMRPRGWTVSNRRHSLCDHHRMIANQTTQRWQRRRLEQQRAARAASAPPLGEAEAQNEFGDVGLSVLGFSDGETSTPFEYIGTFEVAEPTEEDLEILRALLDVDDEAESSRVAHTGGE